MNQLEAQLRSWKPRPPSRKLESIWQNAERRAGAPPRQKSKMPPGSPVLDCVVSPGHSWLMRLRAAAPALACLLLTAAILTQSGEGLIIPRPDQRAIALALSNQNFAPYLPGSFQSTANRLDTFGWTNTGGSPSSMRSLTPPEAIDLQ